MRIISNFHDYYDIGMQNGIDPKLPYQRFRREEHVVFPKDDYRSFGRRCKNFARYYKIVFIGFAGKIYPCIDLAPYGEEAKYQFDLTLIDDEFYLSINGWWGRQAKREKDKRYIVNGIKEDVDELFAYRGNKELLELFEKFKTAIFTYRVGADDVVINERLNIYGFQKILPPIQAFQELEMYVGSYLTQPVIEEPPISDKIKAEIHGFDKYSFRKDKGSD